MASHLNVQIIVQHVTDEPEKKDQYGKVIEAAKKSVLEERLNLTGTNAATLYERVHAAVNVLAGEIPWT